MSRLLLILTLGVMPYALLGCATTGSGSGSPATCCTNCQGDGCCQGDCCGEPDCDDCGACPDCKAKSTGATLEPAPEGADLAVITAGGMGCPLCSSSAEKQLERVNGVKSIAVNLGTGELLVAVDPASQPTAEQLAQAVTDGGFTVQSVTWRKGAVK